MLKKHIVGNCIYGRANICEFPIGIPDVLKKEMQISANISTHYTKLFHSGTHKRCEFSNLPPEFSCSILGIFS